MTIEATYSYKDILKLRRPTNYYSENDINEAVNNPIIIHYTTNMRTIRPWFSNTNHPLSDIFIKYFNMSPWKEKELQEMSFESKESKIIGVVEKLPNRISIGLLGFLHSYLKPTVIRVKTKKR